MNVERLVFPVPIWPSRLRGNSRLIHEDLVSGFPGTRIDVYRLDVRSEDDLDRTLVRVGYGLGSR